MITRNALESFLASLIAAADADDALYEAVLFRNLRGAVTSGEKVVRVDCVSGFFAMADSGREKESELNVQATIQTYCLPADTTDEALDEALDTSLEMSREIFVAIASDPGMNGGVCDANFQEFETGYANLNSTRYGVTWLDGLINTAR